MFRRTACAFTAVRRVTVRLALAAPAERWSSSDTVFVAVPIAGIELLAIWTFARRDDRLTIQRERTAQGEYQLLVIQNGSPRTFVFSGFDRLVSFQSDMESFLVRTGWSLAAFTPDRRSQGDRRQFPRVDNDRRRWWTDVRRDG